MKDTTALIRLGVLCGVALWLAAGPGRSQAQLASQPVTNETRVSGPDLQAELLQAYIRLQAQLNDAQLAIEKSRADAEKSAREQATAITEKLSAIQAALDADQAALNADQVRQQKELKESNQTMMWVAGIFGCAGMLAMFLTALFQWRTTNRLTEISAWRPQLGAGSSNSLLPVGAELAGGKAVELSNQRMLAVIERLERRVFELEHTSPGTTAVGDSGNGSQPVGAPANSAEIAALLDKGQSLLNEEKAQQALECYDAILELDPKHSEALVKKGAALERLKQDEEALRCYDLAIEADRTLTIAYLYKGGIYNRLERYSEALECYEQALKAQGQPT